jgi:Family of unknown function (DUF6049)
VTRTRRVATRVGGWLGVVGVLLLLAPVAGQAITAQGGGSSTPTTTPSATDPAIRLISQSGFVAPTGLFRVSLSVPLMPAGSTVKASVYPRATTSTLDQTAQGNRLPSHITRDVTVPLAGTITPGDTQMTVDLGYQLASSGTDPPLGFTLFQAGVYPVAFTISDAAGNPQGRLITHLVRLPDVNDQVADPTPLTVALVVPMSAPVAHQPDGSIELSDDQATALRSVVDTLNRYPAVPVSLAPTPETLGALAATDRSNTPIGPALRSAAGGGRQVISAPFVDVPASSWIDQGLADRYSQELSAGADRLRATLGTAPDQATAAVDATTSPAVLSQLATNGAKRAVVPRNRLAPTSKLEEASTLTQTFDLVGANGEPFRSVATDTRLSDRLTAPDDPVLNAHEVLAALSLIALDTSSGQPCVSTSRSTSKCSRGVAIQLPADAASAQPALEALLSALNDRLGTGIGGTDGAGTASPATGIGAGAPLLSALTVNSLIDVVDAASSTGSTGPSSQPRQRQLSTPDAVALGSYPGRLEAVAGQVGGFRSLLTGDDPTGFDLARSLDMVLLSSGATSLDDAGRRAYLDGASTTVRSQTDQITSPEQQIVTLTSGEGKIPLSISNALPYPVQVTITFVSAKLEFTGPQGAQLSLLLPANTPTPILVPVRVRASGAFPLEVTVRSPDNTLAITSTKFTVRSTAVSGVGLVLTIIAGLFLLLWWARHFRDTRRARRLVASTHPVLRSNGRTDGPTDGSGPAAAPGDSRAIRYAPADTD